jgi:hypothetical protein
MMRSIEGVVSAAGYRLVVTATGADAAAEIDTIHGMNRGYADGLIISPLRITPEVVDALVRAPVPVVVIGSLPPKAGLDNVRANSVRGTALASDHLVKAGRRRIAFVTVRSTRPLASHGCAGTGGPSAPTTPTTTPPWWRLPPTSRPRPARRQRGRCSRTPSRTLCCARTTCWPSGRCGPSQRPDGVSRQTPPSSGWTTPTSPNSPHRR